MHGQAVCRSMSAWRSDRHPYRPDASPARDCLAAFELLVAVEYRTCLIVERLLRQVGHYREAARLRGVPDRVNRLKFGRASSTLARAASTTHGNGDIGNRILPARYSWSANCLSSHSATAATRWCSVR